MITGCVSLAVGNDFISTQRRHQFKMGRYRGPIPTATVAAATQAPVSAINTGEGAKGQASKMANARPDVVENDIDDEVEALIHQAKQSVNNDRTVDALEDELGSAQEQHKSTGASSSTVNSSPRRLPSFKVKVMDKFGMPAGKPQISIDSLDDLNAILPQALKDHFSRHCRRFHIRTLTQPQQFAMPFIFEGRDVVCISPTASGKTLAYLVPSVAQILVDERSKSLSGGDGSSDSATKFDARSVEALIHEKISTGEVCRYCELNVLEHPVCPITGHVHKPPSEETEGKQRANSFKELSSLTEPKLVVLVPTSQLALQIGRIAEDLRCGLRVSALYRAPPEEKAKMLRRFEGCDILITTPEPLIQALYKGKLSLRRVQVLVMDEVDALLSVSFFEQIKIILGALPKKEQRPQRLLFGATLPPPMHEMIRRDMLLPSHRFVLGESNSSNAAPAANTTDDVSQTNLVTHTVLMVSRVEKIDKIVWLYETGKLRGDQRTIIFCNSKHNVNYVSEQLTIRLKHNSAVKVVGWTSDLNQLAKDGILKMFQSGVASVLVCTDAIGRGIDFHNVVYVVNFEMPTDMEQWIHRVGRCGRHGMKGYVYSLFQPENVRLAKPLVAHLRQMNQLVPPKLQEYAKQSFVDIFKNSTFLHPTQGSRLRKVTPEAYNPVLGRGKNRIPDYRQQSLNKNFRPN